MRLPLLALLLLAACGRPLTSNERAFLSEIPGDALDLDRVRLHDGLAPEPPRLVPVPPRVTCQARLYPPRPPAVRITTGAMALFQDVHLRGDLYRPDLMAGWPEVLPLADAMLLAHEMVHVWQWQARATTGYHPLLAAFEHAASPDPYLFDVDSEARFLDHGWEQQGAIMEEYVCCRTLAPGAARTKRLHAMLLEHFDLRSLDEPLASRVLVPWPGVETEGICG